MKLLIYDLFNDYILISNMKMLIQELLNKIINKKYPINKITFELDKC